MNQAAAPSDWHAANWHYLSGAIDRVRLLIGRSLQPENSVSLGSTVSSSTVAEGVVTNFSYPLNQLCVQFQLSSFERDVLLACAGVELDARFIELYGRIQGEQRHPTFHLLLSVLPEAHWSAFLPNASLRYWRMIEVGAGPALMHSPLRIDERILHYLMAQTTIDDRFQGILFRLSDASSLVPSQQAMVQQISHLWEKQPPTIVQLYGNGEKQTIAAAVANELNQQLYRLPMRSLPNSPGDISQLVRLWERETRLHPAILLLDCDGTGLNDPQRQNAVAHLLEDLTAPLIITTPDRDRTLVPANRPCLSLELQPPTTAEQYHLWQTTLKDRVADLNGGIDRLAHQFTLSPTAIQSIGLAATPQHSSYFSHLWHLCRIQTRPGMDDLAQRIETAAGWSDLVLPEAQLQILRAVTAQVRQRIQVYQHWGFGGKGRRGLGISALFAGASGTGKTMAAEVLAQELQLDLYRIDLSAIVSKYIGETEKNLRRVFDAAESGSVVLLFDEADALFGKRSEVKDSHDRYANMEVSYLLQRMEAYQGLAILTTNLKEAIDTAFLRRLRFVIKFPFPDAVQREEIWRRAFPTDTPVAELDLTKLARLNVAGGNIRNIALNAAFLAADAETPVGMPHLLAAAKAEYAKLERTLTDAEVRGWL